MNAKVSVELKPVDMTEDVMENLERRGLIIRMCPHHDDLNAQPGETLSKSVYESGENYGPHKLITVTVNCEEFTGFGTHPDNEEFILIGDADTQPMYLAIALVSAEELDAKISANTVTPDDFIALRVKYNDPYVSFFVMKADVPHGEAIVDEGKRPPSFYVTESRDLPLSYTAFGNYHLKISNFASCQ